jgi:hypothetical protein
VLLVAVTTAAAVLQGVAGASQTRPAGVHTEFECARHPERGTATCLAERRTDIPVRKRAEVTSAAAPSGYAPADLSSAYHIPAAPIGTAPTVAIVDAYDDPSAEADLGVYRSQYHLPTCSTANGCFRKVSQTGGSKLPSGDSGWATEISVDMDMVSAVCPGCKILLVEASSAAQSNLSTAANYAAGQVGIGGAVSNSYGGSEFSGESDSAYTHSGVAMVASSGDEGYVTEFPAASPNVIAVGGTSLTRSTTNARGWTESVWDTSNSEGTGSGCSKYEAKPSWQKDPGCARRTLVDVAADADPATGVAVYDSYHTGGWAVFGGTSVASPIVATMYAMSGLTKPSAQSLYTTPNGLGLNDVTTGSNSSTCGGSYLCQAGVGYDGPTGTGTPWGLAALGGPASTSPSAPFTISTNPSAVTVTPGTNSSAITVTTAVVGTNSAESVNLTATGLPTGVTTSLPPSTTSGSTPVTMMITVPPATKGGTYLITLTAADTSNNTATTTLTLTVPAPCNSAPQLANPGFELGNTGWTSTPDVIGKWTGAEAPHTGSYDGWMGGYSAKHTDSLSQTITVPGLCHTATLTYWVKMVTTQTRTATDSFVATLGTLTATFNNTTAPTGWQQETMTYTLPPGQATVPMSLTGNQAGSAATSFVVDDTSLTFS